MGEMIRGRIHGDCGMARHLRELDWSSSPLGPIDTWPDPLLTAVNMILCAPLPMQLFWGPELICLYNDAMAPAVSDKHPQSFGQPARQVWAEAWHMIGPQLEAVLAEGKVYRFDDVLLPLLKNGRMEEQYWTYSYSPIFDSEGTVIGVLDVAQDATESFTTREQVRQANEIMRRSEERFRLLADRATVGINIGDSTGAITYMNQTLLSLIGYTAEDIYEGRVRWNELTPEKYAAADQAAIAELKATGVATPYEKVYRAKDGHLVPVQLGAVAVPALSLTAIEEDYVVFSTDLTKQKKAEAALVQVEKLVAVGKLASAVSHEINNPLEAVTNVLFIVRRMPDLPQDAKDYLEVVDRELARVSQVAAQTLRFHRLSTTGLQVRPDQLMQEVLDLYASRLKNYSITVRRDYAPDVSLTCFEGDIRQVLNNLVGNAVDVMRQGGQLTIRTREATRWSTGARGVRITVADSGGGILAEARAHLFDAFFTTKGIHGTGLGLWICCRIVHKHRAFIRSYSAFGGGHGAVFQLWLPLELAPSAHEPWHDLAREPGLHAGAP